MAEILYKTQALKQLKKIPEPHRTRIIRAISFLADDPHRGKKLQGDLQGIYSLRVWPYRVLYQIGKRIITVIILAIGHRQGVYK